MAKKKKQPKKIAVIAAKGCDKDCPLRRRLKVFDPANWVEGKGCVVIPLKLEPKVRGTSDVVWLDTHPDLGTQPD